MGGVVVAGVQGRGKGQSRQMAAREGERASGAGLRLKEDHSWGRAARGEAEGDEMGEKRQCREGAVIPAGGRATAAAPARSAGRPKAESVSGCERAGSGERGRRAASAGAARRASTGSCGGPLAPAGGALGPAAPRQQPQAPETTPGPAERAQSPGSGAAERRQWRPGDGSEKPRQTCGRQGRPSGRRPAGERH
ncbi:POLG alternative reading frame-like [Marmota marmota marmota]|uniref:POLG alternative reading frame-like n=1 Tax=Marmota marmota marmota TaxID=9994 RepID=UPI002093A62F|nr:POLG alternative reading frame-like [Marmota marmota marmota]